MNLDQLNYTYPDTLIATEKTHDSRVMYIGKNKSPLELTKTKLLNKFQAGDLLIINDTKVEKRRIHTTSGLEVLFIEDLGENKWQVLFPASRIKDQDVIELPGNISFKLFRRGIPQQIIVSKPINKDYFKEFGQMALPPYIQKMRGQRSNNASDETSYQTDWAKNSGSCAAPTASLHFNNNDILSLKDRGVKVCQLTLHVGLGTFLPIREQNILEHKMHSEEVFIPCQTIEQLKKTKSEKNNIWTLGTTATRAIESIEKGYFKATSDKGLLGSTDLFLYPGKSFDYVNRLMTNFHQPGSTLIALVAAFSGIEQVKSSYQWAIDQKFALFSYGDLSVWER